MDFEDIKAAAVCVALLVGLAVICFAAHLYWRSKYDTCMAEHLGERFCSSFADTALQAILN